MNMGTSSHDGFSTAMPGRAVPAGGADRQTGGHRMPGKVNKDTT
jgi:hypothetical protein